jgi:hypothetical protein
VLVLLLVNPGRPLALIFALLALSVGMVGAAWWIVVP